MNGFDKLNKYLKGLADGYPDVLVLPVSVLYYNVELGGRYIQGIDIVFETKDIAKKTKLKVEILNFDSIDSIDSFYYDVVWNMSLDDYERELKYIANIDDDDENDYVALLTRIGDTFEIKIELIK